MSGPLDYRILDLTTQRSWLTGKMLADLGADVVKVEPPGGDPGRNSGPFAHDEPGIENSLQWWAFNRGKKSITLALDTAEGREIFLDLVAGADAVIESFTPGQLEEWGLGFDQLQARNPKIVLTRVTPFGQTGPYAKYKANDLILAAISGPAWMAGDEDRPPVRTSVPQYELHGALEAVPHTEIALYHAAQSGTGQQIDVSAQLASIRTLMNSFSFPRIDGTVMRRSTFGAPTERVPYRQIFKCADGYVMASPVFPPGLPAYMKWVTNEGATVPQELTELDPEQLVSPAANLLPQEIADAASDMLSDFFATRTKYDLMNQAIIYRVMLVPVHSIKDIVEDEQLADRHYFTGVRHDDTEVTYPTVWAHFSETPLEDNGRAPHVGEHNHDVLVRGLGRSEQQLADYVSRGIV